jgi:uncharacterized protein YbjT (DUF2867 family)
VVVCVIGASGDLGRRVCAGLRAGGVGHRPLTRRGDALFADLADPYSLDVAFEGASRLFLVSSPVPGQVQLETNAIEAAERAGFERVVKISNIPIAGLGSGVHGNHRAIERRLDASPVAATVLQPSFFTTVIDRQRALVAKGRVVLPFGSGRVAWVDPQDIADVAVVALTGAVEGPIRITGPESLDGDAVAARLGVRRLDPPLDAWRDRIVADGLDPWLADATVELYAAVACGALAEVSPDVERVLGRPPRRAFVDQAAGQ